MLSLILHETNCTITLSLFVHTSVLVLSILTLEIFYLYLFSSSVLLDSGQMVTQETTTILSVPALV